MPTRLVVAVVLLAGLAAVPSAARAQPIAQAGGWTLSLEEVDRHLAAKFHELREQKVEELVIGHLLAAEAKARGVEAEQLVAQEVAKRAAAPTPQEVKQFIAANKDRLPNGGEGMEERVTEYLHKNAQKQAQGEFVEYLQKKHGVKIFLKPPRFEVNGPQDLVRGKADAPITLIEFSDFECPYCGRVQSTLKSVEKTYGDKLRIVFRHYPLEFHKQAPKASEAAQCAADQGQFWPFHDILFADQEDLSIKRLEAVAADLKLDQAQFKACLADGRHAARVAADVKEGQRLGITGTPTFFVNGIKLVGAVPLIQFQKTIDAELKGK